MSNEVPLILRLLWFVCLGLWLGGVASFVAWVCCLSIIGFPVGIYLLDRLPTIMTLKARSLESRVIPYKDTYLLQVSDIEQPPLIVRVLWLVLIGWWLSFFWILLASILAGSFIGIPFAFWMFNRVPRVLWLTRM